MFDLTHKIALVTGAASGIGESIAKCFAAAGAAVFVADRDEPNGRRVAAEIGANATFLPLDVTDPSACAQAAQTLLDRHAGRCDILVNNAGIGHVGSLPQTNPEDMDRLWSVNVRGAFILCKLLVPGMLSRGSGSVINMASIAGIVACRDRLAYTTSKFAVVGLTKALALDHSYTGVRFNSICPGRVETPFVQARIAEYPDPKKAYQEMSSTQLNGRMIRPDEVAAAALYLASDESAMVTGSTLMIDGGWSAGK
jgi:NAD(P)-dependent dehydrogenase (short-subunit alcohol dehydrogenase family)